MGIRVNTVYKWEQSVSRAGLLCIPSELQVPSDACNSPAYIIPASTVAVHFFPFSGFPSYISIFKPKKCWALCDISLSTYLQFNC